MYKNLKRNCAYFLVRYEVLACMGTLGSPILTAHDEYHNLSFARELLRLTCTHIDGSRKGSLAFGGAVMMAGSVRRSNVFFDSH